MDFCECNQDGKFFSPGKNGDMIIGGCPNCNRPYRSQVSPTIDEMKASDNEMIDAAADGGYNKDMSGNPLKEGILEDNGWQNRNKRDEFVGSTLNQDPYLPWWHVSSEEHQIEGDAEIESVMPPTEGQTVEARLVDGSPGWHGLTNNVAIVGSELLGEPLIVDGEPFGPEMARELTSQFMSPDHPDKTFMISHSDPEYLEAVKEVIETGKNGPALNTLMQKIKEVRDNKHKDQHGLHESVIDLKSDGERGHFHDDNVNLSRALYGVQAYANGLPYVSADQRSQDGLNAVHDMYQSGATQIPISTSHPELGEVLQRVHDFDSMSPLRDWLMNSPDLSKEQERALNWLIDRKFGKVALVGNPPSQAPTQTPSWADDLLEQLRNLPEVGDDAAKGLGKESPKLLRGKIPWLGLLTAPFDPNPQDIIPGVHIPNPTGDWENPVTTRPDGTKGDEIPSYLDAARNDPVIAELLKKNPEMSIPQVIESPETKQYFQQNPDEFEKLDASIKNAIGPIVAPESAPEKDPKPADTNFFDDAGSAISDAANGVGDAISDGASSAKNFVTDTFDDIFGGDDEPSKPKDPESFRVDPPQRTEPNRPSTAPQTPPATAPATPRPAETEKPAENEGSLIPQLIAPIIAPAIGLGTSIIPGLGGDESKSPSPNPRPQPSENPNEKPPRTKEKPPRPRRDKKFRLPIPEVPLVKWDGPEPAEYQGSGVTTPTASRKENMKRSADKETPTSHGEIPANDIEDPEEIDPHEKNDGDNQNWEKDFSVNGVGGSDQDPGAVVVTVTSDDPIDQPSIKEIGEILGLDEGSEPMKLMNDFFDHFLDLSNKSDDHKNSDPILSLFKKLLDNERDNGKD